MPPLRRSSRPLDGQNNIKLLSDASVIKTLHAMHRKEASERTIGTWAHHNVDATDKRDIERTLDAVRELLVAQAETARRFNAKMTVRVYTETTPKSDRESAPASVMDSWRYTEQTFNRVAFDRATDAPLPPVTRLVTIDDDAEGATP